MTTIIAKPVAMSEHNSKEKKNVNAIILSTGLKKKHALPFNMDISFRSTSPRNKPVSLDSHV